MARSARAEGIFTLVIVVAAIVALAAFLARAVLRGGSTNGTASAGRATREVVMSCTTDMATRFHIHPFLTIMIDGEKRTIPANVGIDKGCMHPLHTHDDTGMLHVESPVKRDFTLGDFFMIWGMPFDKDRILDRTVDESHEIRLLVNGDLSQDYGDLVLHDGDQIMIAYQKKK